MAFRDVNKEFSRKTQNLMGSANKTTSLDGEFRFELSEAPESNPPTTSQSFPASYAPALTPNSELVLSKPSSNPFKRVALVGSGVSLGLVLTIFAFQALDRVEPVQQASAASQIEIQVSTPLETATSESEILVKAIPSEAVRANYAELESWFAEQAVPVSQRKFLSSASRGGKSIVAPFQQPAKVSSSRQAPANYEFNQIDSKSGRYGLQGDATQWQGGWKLNDPAANIKTAQSYKSYVSKELGSGMNSNLRAFRHPSGELLKQTNQSLAPLK